MHQVLERWGFSGDLPPDRRTLERVHRAWLRHVPFENASKLIGARTFPPERWCRSSRRFWIDHFRWGCGGTCFDATAAMAGLLSAIGFSPRIVFCRLPGKPEQSHVALVVGARDDDGREADRADRPGDARETRYLVDVGYALPCPVALPAALRERRRTRFYDLEIRKGVEGEYLVLTEDSRGLHFRYAVRPAAVGPDAFRRAWDATFLPAAPYMRRLALGRFRGRTRYIYKGPSSPDGPSTLYVLTRDHQRAMLIPPGDLSRLSMIFGLPAPLLRNGAAAAREKQEPA